MIRIVSLFALVSLAGCPSGGSANKPNPCGGGNPCGDPCGGGDPCAKADAPDFSGWDGWTKISKAPFESKGHGGGWVEVFVDQAADAYKALSGPMPVGMRVVKAVYTDQSGSNVKMLTVMKKMPAGYDKDNGDWLYGIYDADGKTAKGHGKLPKCLGCHDAQGAETDYVIGVPAEHRAE